MIHDDLDRVLSHEEDILPSSSFATSVMDAVRQEAAAPTPIRFPWMRALPGLVATGLAFAWAFLILFKMTRAAAQFSATEARVLALSLPTDIQPTWITLAVLVTAASLAVSVRFASGRS